MYLREVQYHYLCAVRKWVKLGKFREMGALMNIRMIHAVSLHTSAADLTMQCYITHQRSGGGCSIEVQVPSSLSGMKKHPPL